MSSAPRLRVRRLTPLAEPPRYMSAAAAGLDLVAAPVDPIHLEPGQTLTLRFRVWVHQGDAKEGMVQEAYELFAQPPTLSLSD